MTDVKKINLAFQGGGSHGAVTWGVADRLLEDGRLSVEGISGASAGAVNAAALAYGLHKGGNDGGRELMENLWREISDAGKVFSPVSAKMYPFGGADIINAFTYQMFDTLTRTFSPYELNPFDFNPLRDILENCIDFESLRRCQTTKLFINATNVRSGKVKVFETPEISTEVICASACLPHLYKAVEIDGEEYWDGGYTGNPVLFPFYYAGVSSDIVIVHVNPIERDEVPKRAAEIMNRVNEISFNSSLQRELRSISFVHKLLDDGWLKDEFRDRLRNVRIHSIRSDKALADYSVTTKYQTDWDFLNDLKERGREIADEWLTENFESLGNHSSVDLRQMFE